MKILILGGTVFLGRALVEAALQGEHTVTLFNRGRSNPELFPEVEKLIGDRNDSLAALQGRHWDAAIDTNGYYPRQVRNLAGLLAQAVDHYTFISSLSVYADNSQPGLAEDAPLAQMADETVEQVTGETYGPLKALCEQAAEQALPGRSLILRPGLIVGPHDPTDRFTYWPHRVAQGGETLAPGRPARPVQFIDVRDLAEWNLRMVEASKTGVYNANGPAQPLSMEEVLETCRRVSASDARFTWASEAYLLEHKVEPWSQIPLWVPESDPEMAGFFAFDSSKAIAAGLTFRTLELNLPEWERFQRSVEDV
ncbi:MAG TPA: SDR family oxidoreductase, partial [Anaerolineales bacterium]